MVMWGPFDHHGDVESMVMWDPLDHYGDHTLAHIHTHLHTSIPAHIHTQIVFILYSCVDRPLTSLAHPLTSLAHPLDAQVCLFQSLSTTQKAVMPTDSLVWQEVANSSRSVRRCLQRLWSSWWTWPHYRLPSSLLMRSSRSPIAE